MSPSVVRETESHAPIYNAATLGSANYISRIFDGSEVMSV